MKQLKELDVAGQATQYDFFVQWHLTERCNLRCKHCYQAGTPTGGELTLADAKNIVAEVADTLKTWAETYGVGFSPSFNITGGEPFLRRDLFDIIGEVKARGFAVYLLTNGTIARPERAETLATLGVEGVQVSIEGTEDVHDSIRGRGSFSQTIWGVKNLLDAGLTVTLNTTLSGLNARCMSEMVSLALGVGVQRLGFSRFVPSGRGLALLKEMLRPEQVKEIYGAILSVDIDGLEVVTGDPLALQMKMKGTTFTGCTAFGGCAAGISGFTLLADGTITPCRRLPVSLGNVKRDSIREIWATSKVLGSLRDKSRYKGRCGSCDRWATCRGCRAIAYAYSLSKGENDFLAEDPQCFLETEKEPAAPAVS